MKKAIFEAKLKATFPDCCKKNPEKISGTHFRTHNKVGKFYNKEMEQSEENTYIKYNYGGQTEGIVNNDVLIEAYAENVNTNGGVAE
jgi:hypothetical protein